MKRALALLGTLALLAAAPSNAARFTPDDVHRIVGITDPQISPDGKHILVVVTRLSLDDDRGHSDLVSVDPQTGASTTQLTDVRSLGSPRWSPDGAAFAFMANDQKDGKGHTQIFVAKAAGGDPAQITHSATGVQQYAWSPDGKRFAFVADLPAPKKEKFDKSFVVGNGDYLATHETMSAHAFVIDADGTHQRQLTDGSWSLPKVLPPSAPASPVNFSPDGHFVAITHRRSPYGGDSRGSYVELVNVENGRRTKLTKHLYQESDALYSPSGKRIAYAFTRARTNDGGEGEFAYNVGRGVMVTTPKRGNGKLATAGLDRNVVRAMWIDDDHLLVAGHDATASAAWVQTIGGKAQRLALGDVQPREAFSFDGSLGKDGTLAFVGSTPRHPSELYYMPSLRATPRALTHYNDEIARMDLGANRTLTWTGPNKFTEDGVLTTPPGFNPHKKYPLVLYIHGGPTSSSTTAFSTFPQVIAAREYVVFEPNYRGSDNLGDAYQAAIGRDRGAGPGRDVMAGIAAVSRLPFVNRAKTCVTGWSYGGYMTSWMIGHYGGWTCAIAGAAVNNMFDAYNLSDGNAARANGFYPSPYLANNFAHYWANSPVSAFPKIHTPTLILSDVGDYRVPIVQSYEMFHALQDLKVPTQFVAYDVSGHSPPDPYNFRDVQRRWVQWLDKYLR